MFEATWICIEGIDGIGKTTQCQMLVDRLRDQSMDVLKTSEPGSVHTKSCPIIRRLMLDQDFANEVNPVARELLSQAARSIHMERVIAPALFDSNVDYIVQDRGLLSGISYAQALENENDLSLEDIVDLTNKFTLKSFRKNKREKLYDVIIRLVTEDVAQLYLSRRVGGTDAMEAKGAPFLTRVQEQMCRSDIVSLFTGTIIISILVDGYTVQQVHNIIWESLKEYKLVE